MHSISIINRRRQEKFIYRFIVLLMEFILLTSFLWTSMIHGQEETEEIDDAYMEYEEPGVIADPFLAQANTNVNTGSNMNGPSGGLPGFADTPWKTTYEQVLSRMKTLATSDAAVDKVEILNAVRNRSIKIKRNDVIYNYSFYKTPYKVQKLTNHQLSEEEFDQQEGVLFHVKITPPFLDATLVNKKLTDRYGRRTRTTIKEGELSGAEIWELNGGIIVQWFEPYKKKAYTRTVDYISDEVAKKIMTEYEDFFDSKEKQILKDLIIG